jgi:hypothetical protein
MSQTKIYWYPMGSGNLETITLGFVSDLQDDDPEVEAATAETIAGGMYRQLYGDWRRVVVMRQHLRPQLGTDAEAIRGLRSLQSHLLAGYSIGLAVGSGSAFGSYTVAGASRGVDVIGIPANTYAAWDASAALANGDEIVIQSPSPDGAREVHEVNTVTAIGSTFLVSLTRPLRYDHPGRMLVRKRTFYPHLKMPEDQLQVPIVTTSTRGQTFDLRLELREDMQEAWDTGASGDALTGATGQPRAGLGILDGVRELI